MRAFWDVLWTDAVALVAFAVPMAALSFLTAGLSALVSSIFRRPPSPRHLVRTIIRGAVVGCLAGLLLGMLVDYGLSLEGFSSFRRSVRQFTIAPLWVLAALVAGGTALVAVRRNVDGLFGSARAKRRFTLRQLFAAQFTIGLALGWWVFTRRDEIGNRGRELAWYAQLAADRALFGQYGWETGPWDEYDELRLRTFDDELHVYPPIIPPRTFTPQPNVTDKTLDLIAYHPRVTLLVVVSDGVTDAGLKRLTRNQRLTSIRVKSDQITDAGVEQLCALPALQILGLHSDQLTAKSLEKLASVKTIQVIVINGSQIAPQDAAAFRIARPDVALHVNEPWW